MELFLTFWLADIHNDKVITTQTEVTYIHFPIQQPPNYNSYVPSLEHSIVGVFLVIT